MDSAVICASERAASGQVSLMGNAVSAGASGAIFGIIGGLLWIVIVNKGHYEKLTGKGLIFMIILIFYYGITEGNVDNWDHLGGLICGFVLF